MVRTILYGHQRRRRGSFSHDDLVSPFDLIEGAVAVDDDDDAFCSSSEMRWNETDFLFSGGTVSSRGTMTDDDS